LRQRFWELAGSKLRDILGVEKTTEQADADTSVVGGFKEKLNFSLYMKEKTEAFRANRHVCNTKCRQVLKIIWRRACISHTWQDISSEYLLQQNTVWRLCGCGSEVGHDNPHNEWPWGHTYLHDRAGRD
jgi:hypothetical protein